MHGLFIGLTTLDLVYLTQAFPHSNQKIVALDQSIAAGGPATNAAVTFRHLGNEATLLSVVGSHPLSQVIRTDLTTHSVKLVDLNSNFTEIPSLSSVIVTHSTGERAVVSLNATKNQVTPGNISSNILQGINIILIDGHQMQISKIIAEQAKPLGIPVVIDGGSWKAGYESVLPFVDYAICSANFYPPNCQNQEDVFAYLQKTGIKYIALTQGEKPIEYQILDKRGSIKIYPVKAVDTLGAGDIFHGAFCHFILQTHFVEALAESAKVAAFSCQYFGTRQWLKSFFRYRSEILLKIE